METHRKETEALRHAVELYKKLVDKKDKDVQHVEQVDIGFMFASPIVTRQADESLKPIAPISYKPEVDRIKSEARLSKR